ncbi:AAA family ATPase [Mucilaginibacter robiniae]|uniref:AAA family ATPase n=1 Tax=Mucilaginibacter robiniae TaxID=2728022 RepID=A0A7L5E3M7_9SPHI|nr:AAA family ATPase [Mucilaginibacter robiniae]QJD97695.1 AAA family ATPase [Mucilaginibacter robiniae]
MGTKLLRYKVINFRSIEESDWIEAGENTCLVGTNEAGKTNLLIALWKLNPANKEPIIPLADYPRHLYSQYKADGHEEDVFIKADFELDEAVKNKVAADCGCDPEQVSKVLVQRKYKGTYYLDLPYSKIEKYDKKRVEIIIGKFISILHSSEHYIKESPDLKSKIDGVLNGLLTAYSEQFLLKSDVDAIIAQISTLMTDFGKKQNLPEVFNKQLLPHLKKIQNSFDGKAIDTTPETRNYILKNIPKFVYYSDYGNLDSEIYLPRVIEDLERTDLTEAARAKARTLDVLFQYVKLSPQEIYELGNDRKVIVKKLDYSGNVVSSEEQDLSEEEVSNWAEKKKERGVLLRSAASELTKSFKKWWQQGNYIFSFEADGSHFRINVSDELRPESIELEGRSRGLQWFFSFFLVFLVETKQEHANAILLLDEPGLSLHPLAQYDLATFFRNLSENNQLIYTSHSPFLVDMDNLANVKAVYVDKSSGRTKISANLRYDEADAEKSIYPVHAALGLTVSDTLLLGCTPVLVEGPSDQIQLTLIKRYLISKGKMLNNKELVFIPTGGVRGMGPVTKLVASRDNKLPYVLLDSDKPGKDYLKQVKNGAYKDQQDKVLDVAAFLGDKAFEIEDLIPVKAVANVVDRMFRGKTYFEDGMVEGEPIVDQIEQWVKENSIVLQQGWKVDVARELLNNFDRVTKDVPAELEAQWVTLFETFSKN